MATHDKHDHEPGRSSVALFESQAEARAAIAALHKAHFTHTWLGVTSLAETDGGGEAVTVESKAGGFFSDSQSLVDALVSRGVLGDTARQIEGGVEPGHALLTIDPKDKDLNEALAIVESHGGRVAGRSVPAGAAPRTPPPAVASGFDDSGDTWQTETFYRRASTSR